VPRLCECECVCVCVCVGEKNNTKDTRLLLVVREAEAFFRMRLCNNEVCTTVVGQAVVVDSRILREAKITFRVQIRVLIFITQLWHECLWPLTVTSAPSCIVSGCRQQ
jgi:hypothetical protein